MLIRFRQTTPSANPDIPFQAGQVIRVPRLDADMRRWMRDGHVELIREEAETPTAPDVEHAVVGGPKKKR